MPLSTPQPICGFDIGEDNSIQAVDGASDGMSIVGPGRFRWLHFDLADPSLEAWAKRTMPEIPARALTQSETRPRCEELGDGIILNLRGVNLNPDSDPEDMVSLRMWITPQSIVSARARRVFAVDAIRKDMAEGKGPKTVGAFLAELTHGLTARIEAVTLELESKTDDIEENALLGSAISTADIGTLRQSVIKLKRFVNPQREALEELTHVPEHIVSSAEKALIRETGNHARRSVEQLDATRERLAAIQDQIGADRANLLSRNSYLLSVVAAIFLPLGFLTGLFGVNVAGMPGSQAPYAFWILTLGSVIAGAAFYIIFRILRWF